ncbi:hypothetical protein J8657_10430 [Dickeya oryzae]|uniref:Uncharacterized protein n=1 Tax=Dickeya oryzae TaxID=1240404 RepID=A0AB39IMT7_9GAMM|nr:hypothetical protein [Dickeya oryzae]MBP2858015.1 hypothetical protein [Dickeya oryzae]MCA6991350.1 hypothetical protein [Dickeya oryzae]MCA6993483.1 hypothetical protein [Dickeya oryzae]
MNESLLLAFANADLGKNSGRYDDGTIIPTNLCKIFVRIGIGMPRYSTSGSAAQSDIKAPSAETKYKKRIILTHWNRQRY